MVGVIELAAPLLLPGYPSIHMLGLALTAVLAPAAPPADLFEIC
jgi:hypothetical protein